MKKIIIFDFNRTIYDPDTKTLFPGTREVLQALHQKEFILYIVGKGNEARLDIINQLNIKEYFENIYLVPEKNIEQLLALKERYPENTIFYSVGDRIKNEISLGNKVGFKTVWLKNGKFSSEIPDGINEQPWKTIEHLSELKEILS